ncbi:hypothetical protein [Vulcanisaeta souniana]|uniref:Uncharacterized protein n=1 Tax=Vulcanisaeta souniana JCM 11219 TaxID=1293586 RepID=A0ABM8BNJ0_9CREN|nr:hypothetical protein [Vulcanisaeta souniana]BDR92535.1 hypothetical protein Vsou_16280 [Vulcanisaeta souniana JCM 11219]
MSRPYLYLIAALIVLIIVSTYLGIQLSIYGSRLATLKLMYDQIMSRYTMLQDQYDNLQSQYSSLENQYSALQSRYNQLLLNYTSLVSVIGRYKPPIEPVIYTYSSLGDGLAIWLNITNPNQRPVNVTVAGVYSSLFISVPFSVLIPPNVTIQVPVLVAFLNPQSYGFGYSLGWVGTVKSADELLGENILIAVINSSLINYGLTGIVFNITITGIQQTNLLDRFGFAEYALNSSLINLYFINPSLSAMTIGSYSIYSPNNTLLASCTLLPTVTINASSGVDIPLSTESTSYVSEPINAFTPGKGWTTTLVYLMILCTPNYHLPVNVAQLPYGYVVLTTSSGNVTIPLLPQQ